MASDSADLQIENSIRILPKIKDGLPPQELNFPEGVRVSRRVVSALGHAAQIPEDRENSPFRLYSVNGLSDLGSFAMWATEEQANVDFIVSTPDATGQTRVDLVTVRGHDYTLNSHSQNNLLKEWKIAHPGQSTLVTFPAVPDSKVMVDGKEQVIEKGGYCPQLMFGVGGNLEPNQQVWALINTDYLPGGKIYLEFQKDKANTVLSENLERLQKDGTVISVEPEETDASQTPASRAQSSDQAAGLDDQIKVGETIHRRGA